MLDGYICWCSYQNILFNNMIFRLLMEWVGRVGFEKLIGGGDGVGKMICSCK